MTVHWTRMTRSLPRLRCRMVRVTGKRVLPFLVAMCLLMPVVAGASTLSSLSEALAQERVQALASQKLEGFDPKAPRRNKAIKLDDWYLHQDGFGFKIPEGYRLMLRYRGTTLTLVDEAEENVSQRTGIAVRLTAEDASLGRLTQKQFVSAYTSQFHNFELRDFSHETKFGTECVRIAFVCGAAPQLFVQQYLFNKNGHGYVIALTMENTLERVIRGLTCFADFTDSLMFAPATERRIAH